MIGNTEKNQFLFENLETMLDPKQALYQLAKTIPWNEVESCFMGFYPSKGRPAKNIRLMVSLIILKRILNLGDETVIDQWIQNPYMQYFSGEKTFQWKMPCDPSDLVHFRKRIGEKGIEKIFKLSIDIHGGKIKEEKISIDTTVQEKNITFPTDMKLYKKIILYCLKMAKEENIKLRRSYTRTIKKLIYLQRGKRTKKGKKIAIKAQRHLKTIAGRLFREIKRKLSELSLEKNEELLKIFERILNQGKDSKNKIYSVNEPESYCISKGKDHKKYEFGTKVSLAVTNDTGIIVGAINIKENEYDGKTITEALDQVEKMTGVIPKTAGTDQGYRGISNYKGCMIINADKLKRKSLSCYERKKIKKLLRRRASIEAIISSLKNRHRLSRNYLSGTYGNTINVMLSAAGFNFKKWMRKVKLYFCDYFYKIIFLQKILFCLNIE